MLKKRLGIECIERSLVNTECFKISSPLIIPDGCEKIGDWAFYYYLRLEKVVIPESVKVIGTAAFACCRMLKEVKIPKSVERIEMIAFDGCTGKNTKIILEKPVNEFEFISSDAFCGCRSVEYAEKDIRD